MNKANDDKRLKALMRLRDTMTVAGVTNEMIKKGEQNSPLDLLVCSHEGIVGQYFFPEIKSAENVFYFSCLMIIDEKVGKKEAKALNDLISEVNEELICGMIAVIPGVGLSYKLTIPIPESITEDALFETMDITAAHAMALSAGFVKRRNAVK